MKTQTLQFVPILLIFSFVLLNGNEASGKEFHPMQPKACIGITAVLDLTTASNAEVKTETAATNNNEHTLAPIEVEEKTPKEEALQIESWMTNDRLFRFESKPTRQLSYDEPLEIENWMTDQNRWTL